MKRFTDNPFVQFKDAEHLEILLERFWEDDEIAKNFPSLCFWLNLSRRKFDYLKRDEEFSALLEGAEMRLESQLIEMGLANDRSFPKFLLETQYGYSKERIDAQESTIPTQVRICIDKSGQ